MNGRSAGTARPADRTTVSPTGIVASGRLLPPPPAFAYQRAVARGGMGTAVLRAKSSTTAVKTSLAFKAPAVSDADVLATAARETAEADAREAADSSTGTSRTRNTGVVGGGGAASTPSAASRGASRIRAARRAPPPPPPAQAPGAVDMATTAKPAHRSIDVGAAFLAGAGGVPGSAAVVASIVPRHSAGRVGKEAARAASAVDDPALDAASSSYVASLRRASEKRLLGAPSGSPSAATAAAASGGATGSTSSTSGPAAFFDADELDVLRSVFASELTVHSRSRISVDVTASEGTHSARLDLEATPGYPDAAVPRVSVSAAGVSRAAQASLTDSVNARARALLEAKAGPMAFELVDVLREALSASAGGGAASASGVGSVAEGASAAATAAAGDAADAGTSATAKASPPRDGVACTLINIDHMHDPARYCKTLSKWARELRLDGCIARVPGKRGCVFVFVWGDDDAVVEFPLRLRTQSVDVDSAGRKCKERMSRVLWTQNGFVAPLEGGVVAPAPTGSGDASRGLSVVDCESLAEVGERLEAAGLPKAVVADAFGAKH